LFMRSNNAVGSSGATDVPEQIIFGNVSKRKLRYYFAEDRLPNYRQVTVTRTTPSV
jgi:hypothetical protein